MSQTLRSLGAGHSFTPLTSISTRLITLHSLELTHRLLATPSQCCRTRLSPRRRPEQRHSSRLLPLLGATFRAPVSAPAATAAPTDPVLPFQDLLRAINGLFAPVTSLLGGEGSWQLYLARRFASEVLAVMFAALAAYWLLTQVAHKTAELPHPLDTAGHQSGGKHGSSGSGGLGGNEVMFLAAGALTTPLARAALAWVLLINVARNTTYILDGFITKFNPRLPNDWLDDVVRLLMHSLTPLDGLLTKLSLVCLVLCSCVVVLRWKDMLLAHSLLPQIEALDRGQELVASFVNPASNLLNWIVIVASASWLAQALGINLQPMLAVGGASGIIIGLATQQVLSNFVSGLNIFLARPFVSGEYISLISQNLQSQTNVSGRVIRVDPMRTLIATEDNGTTTVPNQVIAVSIVVNRSRSPHWSAGKASPLLANVRELRWRMRLPHSALDKLRELEAAIEDALENVLPEDKVRYSLSKFTIVKFIDSGAELTAKVNLAWRLGSAVASGYQAIERKDKQEELIQAALLSLQRVVRRFDGAFQTA